jgi:hypothetical protein
MFDIMNDPGEYTQWQLRLEYGKEGRVATMEIAASVDHVYGTWKIEHDAHTPRLYG